MSKVCGPWWCPKQTAEPRLLKDMEPRNVPGHRRRWPAGLTFGRWQSCSSNFFIGRKWSQHVAESATAQQIAVFRVQTTHWRGLAVLAYMCLPCCLMLCLPSGSVLSTCFFSCFPFLSSFLFPFWSPFLLPFLSPFFMLLLAPVPFFFASLCPIIVLLFVVISSFLHGFYWELSCLMASLSQGLPYCVSFLVSLPPPIIAKTNTVTNP